MTDRKVVAMVVAFLGIAILLGFGIGGLLAVQEKGVPDFIVSITSGALGALAGILSKTSTETSPVEVMNLAADPVPVAETPKPRPRKKA